jgi:hypothetical protein
MRIQCPDLITAYSSRKIRAKPLSNRTTQGIKPRFDELVDFTFFDPGGLNLAISQIVLTGAAWGPASPPVSG